MFGSVISVDLTRLFIIDSGVTIICKCMQCRHKVNTKYTYSVMNVLLARQKGNETILMKH